MPQIGTLTTQKLVGILAATEGVPSTVAALSAQQGLSYPALAAHQVVAQNVAPEVAERGLVTKYPVVCVYCTKLINQHREKFRTFSGDAQMTVEIRVSQDRLDGIEAALHFYVDAVIQVLDACRGDWGDGVSYDGRYDVTFGGVKHGGSNVIQIAKVSLTLEISRG